MNDIITNWIESLDITNWIESLDIESMARGALDHLDICGHGPTMLSLARTAVESIIEDLGSGGGIDGPRDLERTVDECDAPSASVEECEALVSELWNYSYTSDGGMGLHEVTDTFEADIELAARSVVQAHAEDIDWDEEEDED